MSRINRRIVLAARPGAGWPEASHFRLEEAPVPEPAEGQALLRHLAISVDPYQRGRMNEATRFSYAPAVGLGEVMVAGAVARVLASRSSRLAEGDLVVGNSLGWQEYSVAKPDQVYRVEDDVSPRSAYLGILGMPGITAYFGLLDIADPQPGEAVFVTGAAGAVGSTVGQIARIRGCRVVGSAGSDDKAAWLEGELGFDAAFNYKQVEDYVGKLRELFPTGVDVCFDNVGGPQLDAVLLNLAEGARLSLCGAISQYNAARPELGPRLLGMLIPRNARAEGFLVLKYMDRAQDCIDQMKAWWEQGRLVCRETVTEGIESTVPAFLGMLRGENIGKQVVRLDG